MWIRSFDKQHVISITAIRKRLNRIMEDSENKVRISHNRGWRQRNKVWMEMHVSQPKFGPLLTSTTVSGLLDVGRSIHLLTGVEAVFDKDQCGEADI